MFLKNDFTMVNVRACYKDLPRRGRGTAQAVDEGKRRTLYVRAKQSNELISIGINIVPYS